MAVASQHSHTHISREVFYSQKFIVDDDGERLRIARPWPHTDGIPHLTCSVGKQRHRLWLIDRHPYARCELHNGLVCRGVIKLDIWWVGLWCKNILEVHIWTWNKTAISWVYIMCIGPVDLWRSRLIASSPPICPPPSRRVHSIKWKTRFLNNQYFH